MQGKTIIILSPQDWGTMFLSKHHYAVELAKMGNKVYYINPPKDFHWNPFQTIDIGESGYKDLWIVNHHLNCPYWLKFKAITVFHFMMKFHIQKLEKKIGKADIIWSFELGNLYPLTYFSNTSKKLFFPADEPRDSQAIYAANGADLIVSITREILAKYDSYPATKLLVNHGVASFFFENHDKKVRSDARTKIGLSGNFFRKDLDRPVLLKIIRENSDIIFEFWGAYKIEQSNVSGATDNDTQVFINSLRELPNVKMHGPVQPKQLAKELKQMDAFLICYDIQKDQSSGTNYHKIMEYLATGKVIVSNNVSTYGGTGLLEMTDERDTNEKLPALFRNVISNLSLHNSSDMQMKRISFAKKNLYESIIQNQIIGKI